MDWCHTFLARNEPVFHGEKIKFHILGKADVGGMIANAVQFKTPGRQATSVVSALTGNRPPAEWTVLVRREMVHRAPYPERPDCPPAQGRL